MKISLLMMAATVSMAAAYGADVDTLIKQLGDEEFSVRESASRELIKVGEAARKALEKLLKETKDAEARNRAESIMRVLNMAKDFAALTPAERAVAQLPFESAVSENGKEIAYKTYGRGNDFVCDFGNVRIVIEDQTYSDSVSGNFIIGEGGGSASVKLGFFNIESANGVTDVDFRGIQWKVEGKIMKIAGEETGFGGGTNHVIFLDKSGKFKKRVDMSQEKTGKK